MSDKPLHVQVAEALGWTKCDTELLRTHSLDEGWPCWMGLSPAYADKGWRSNVPNFDRDWVSTGPLIEKYEINLGRCCIAHLPEAHPGEECIPWVATSMSEEYGAGEFDGVGHTPLEAICKLVLELAKNGRLHGN